MANWVSKLETSSEELDARVDGLLHPAGVAMADVLNRSASPQNLARLRDEACGCVHRRAKAKVQGEEYLFVLQNAANPFTLNATSCRIHQLEHYSPPPLTKNPSPMDICYRHNGRLQ